MSAEHDDGSSLVSIAAGTLLPAVLGAGLGMIVALSSWTPAADSAFSTFFAGSCVGFVVGLAVSWFMAWHASVVGVLPDKPALAMAWGVVPGLIFGASLGPFFGGVTGWFFGQLVSGIFFGLFFGPVAGVLGWQIGFCAVNFLGGKSHANSH
jgi:hypothetical protein